MKNFGKTKTQEEIVFIARILKSSDIVAIQEVVAGYGGTQAVASLVDALNRIDNQWDYSISPPTNSSPYTSERYAYLWKKKLVQKRGKAYLDTHFTDEIEREPYIIHFVYQQNAFTLVNFHALPKKKQPETEIKYFKYFPEKYASTALIFLGDFNCPQSHSVFNPLKTMGYKPAFINQKTTLRQQCLRGDCLASEYDNFFIPAESIKTIDARVEHFYELLPTIKQARLLSDHLPISITISF